ncbi:MAG: threonine aldolase [Clostridiales bacterium]|nr:threonine aldolase [Clostridiales bacterium]
MYSFRNDYSEGAHPQIFERLRKISTEQNEGYGLDCHSMRAELLIKKHLHRNDASIHFIPGGTQTNLLVISSFLRPFECVIAADTGHINVHETGAIEGTGHKVVTVPHVDGKLTVEGILQVLKQHETEHMVRPAMVYVSNTTELGTVYSKEELTKLSKVCKEQGLLFYLDGARIASALTTLGNDVSLSDYASLTDLFYIGGTKNGALFGEALVICNPSLQADFRYMIKNRGAMLAKGFITGAQFEVMFEENLFFEMGEHANAMARKIECALLEKGYTFYATPCSNQLFPIVDVSYLEKTKDAFVYNIEKELDDGRVVIRFVTSFATTEESVDALIHSF